MSDEIELLLNSYNADTLLQMAEAAGLPVKDARGKRRPKLELMADMQARYFTRERVLASLQKLGEPERAMLNRLLMHGGSVASRTLEREAQSAGLVMPPDKKLMNKLPDKVAPYAGDYSGSPYRVKSRAFADVLARLTYHGLVFSRNAAVEQDGIGFKFQFHPGDVLFVPQAVRPHLPPPEPVPVTAPAWLPDVVEAGEPNLLLRDLYIYWDYARRHELPVLQSGWLSKRALKAIDALLLVRDPLLANVRQESETSRLLMLRLLLVQLGLLRFQHGQLEATGDDPLAIPPFLEWPVARQVEACLQAWIATEVPDPQSRGMLGYGATFGAARQAVIQALKALAVGEWVAIKELVERVRDADANFLIPERSKVDKARGSYYYSRGYPSFYGPIKDLQARFAWAEQQFVEHMTTGMLHELGLLDLGGEAGKWTLVRLSPALGEQQAEAGAGRIVVQPNFQVLAMGPVGLARLARLDLLANRQRADRAVFEYRITRESIYRAQQLGLEVDAVRRFLEEMSGTELPQNVRRSMEEWGAHHERIVFRGGVSLLQVADPALLERLLAAPDTGQHLARPVSAEVALLKKGSEVALTAALAARELLPAVTGSEPPASDQSVTVDEAGRIRALHPLPSLYLRARLGRLAEEASDGTWRLSPATLRRAGGSRERVLAVLQELDRLQRGGLPAGLADRIKAWGGYFGPAAVQTLTLIEFQDQESLDELRQDPALHTRLRPFPAGDRALAVVAPEHLDEVRRALEGKGVKIGD